jgi:glutaredoxin/glutathione-dependent peroxiredoxin
MARNALNSTPKQFGPLNICLVPDDEAPSSLFADLVFPFSLRLGSIAPNFQAETTTGPIDFHEFIGDKWVVLFSHPEDYTPVCTTELGAFAKLEPEFTKRGVKLIGLSANTIESHGGWIKDIDEIAGSKLSFPIIGDKERKVAYLYDM